MSALTGFRLSCKSGQIKVTCPKSNRNQADSNPKIWQRRLAFIKKSVPFCRFCGSNPVFKIKELSKEIKNTSNRLLRLLKVIKGYFREKNSEFFLGRFDDKTLGNQAKTIKKPLKFAQKTRDF
jgi:hypothetical protein